MTSIAAKVEHVKSAAHVPGHTCHWPGCGKEVPPAMWGCKGHWYRLPRWLRAKIWAAYRPGQEADKNPSRQYLAVATEVQRWIGQHRLPAP